MQKQPFLADSVQEFQDSDHSSESVSLTNMDGSQPIIYEEPNFEEQISYLERKLAGDYHDSPHAARTSQMLSSDGKSKDQQTQRSYARYQVRPEVCDLSRTKSANLSQHAYQILLYLNSNQVYPYVQSDQQLMDFLAEYVVGAGNSSDCYLRMSALQQQIDKVSEINQEQLEFQDSVRQCLNTGNYYLFTYLIRQKFGAYPFAEASAGRLRSLINGSFTGGDLLIYQGRRALSIATSRLYSNEMRVYKFMEFFAVLEEIISGEE